MFGILAEDVRTVFDKDPAAGSLAEVVLCYPGLHALWFHRASHSLWRHGMRLPARMLAHFSRFLTGIEIHPGAVIGHRFFIDHGAGVVIGATAEVGDDVLIYQGVVLGGTTLNRTKRHPTIGNGVVIGAGAVVLGAITVGDDARIGSGSVVVKPVPTGATVVGVPGRALEGHPRAAAAALEHAASLPDPITDVLRDILVDLEALWQRVEDIENRDLAAVPARRMRGCCLIASREDVNGKFC